MFSVVFSSPLQRFIVCVNSINAGWRVQLSHTHTVRVKVAKLEDSPCSKRKKNLFIYI